MNRVATLAVLGAGIATAGVCYSAFAQRPMPRLDASSEAAFGASLVAVKNSIPRSKHAEFDKAMAAMARMSLLSGGQEWWHALPAAECDGADRRMRSSLDRKTGDEVIALANGQSMQLAVLQRDANESAAMSTLKNISSGQAQLRELGTIDRNGNGVGEHGWFGEMAGVSDIELPGDKIVRVDPPVLHATFGMVSSGRVMVLGYYFQMFLPSSEAHPVTEGVQVDAAQAEVLWCCYAWPVTYGDTGERVFFINQSGDVLATRSAGAKYSGTSNRPQPLAAYSNTEMGMRGMTAANATGSDGEAWVSVH